MKELYYHITSRGNQRERIFFEDRMENDKKLKSGIENLKMLVIDKE